jgi:hypothetical protein
MAQRIRLSPGSQRNTKCYVLELGPHTLYWSYTTCVAYSGPACPAIGIRLMNTWGPATGRHMADMGCKHFPVVSDAQFDAILNNIYKEQFHP